MEFIFHFFREGWKKFLFDKNKVKCDGEKNLLKIFSSGIVFFYIFSICFNIYFAMNNRRSFLVAGKLKIRKKKVQLKNRQR